MISAEKTDVILSAGVGRLHFIEIARQLADLDVNFELVCGYIPSPRSAPLLNLVGPLVGRRNLARRLQERLGGGRLAPYLLGNGLAEGVSQGLLRLSDLGLLPRESTQAWAWRFFGRRTRRYLTTQKVFHVRSGAGRGGAIAKAKRNGMQVVVDHSIAHPAYIARRLVPEYARVGARFGGRPESPFWRQVIEDCREADVILVNSNFVKRSFVEEGFDAERLEVIYWGVRPDFSDLKTSYAAAAPFRLLFTGNLELRKGLRILIEAAEALRDGGFRFELHVAGNDAEARRYYPKRLVDLPIVWHGSLVQEDLKRLLATSDLYVFPTYAEGCARSAMEAVAAGLPVVTTESCGLPGQAGLHYWPVSAGDANGLATAIRALASDQSLRAQIGQAGAAYLRDGGFTWRSYGEQLIDLYSRLKSLGRHSHV